MIIFTILLWVIKIIAYGIFFGLLGLFLLFAWEWYDIKIRK